MKHRQVDPHEGFLQRIVQGSMQQTYSPRLHCKVPWQHNLVGVCPVSNAERGVNEIYNSGCCPWSPEFPLDGAHWSGSCLWMATLFGHFSSFIEVACGSGLVYMCRLWVGRATMQSPSIRFPKSPYWCAKKQKNRESKERGSYEDLSSMSMGSFLSQYTPRCSALFMVFGFDIFTLLLGVMM